MKISRTELDFGIDGEGWNVGEMCTRPWIHVILPDRIKSSSFPNFFRNIREAAQRMAHRRNRANEIWGSGNVLRRSDGIDNFNAGALLFH